MQRKKTIQRTNSGVNIQIIDTKWRKWGNIAPDSDAAVLSWYSQTKMKSGILES